MCILLAVGILSGCGSAAESTSAASSGMDSTAVSGAEAADAKNSSTSFSVSPQENAVTAASEDGQDAVSSGSLQEAAESSGQETAGEPGALSAESVSATSEENGAETLSKGITIALDPGHQAPDVDMSATEPNAPGSSVMKTKATGGTSGTTTGLPEYELNLQIALKVRDLLEEEGYGVVMTREDNETAISNAERATLANESGAALMVRIHANGSTDPSANGALALIGSQSNPYVGGLYDSSYALATDVLDAYCQATGMANDGVTTSDTMTGINWSTIPVMILEMGFMTNPTDDTNMADASYQDRMASGIVAGIQNYLQK